jgi:HK97 gp10 family phage protein
MMKTYTYPGMTIRENMSEILTKFVPESEQKLNTIIRKYALKIQAETARDAPVDLGTLRNSIEAVKDGTKKLSWIVQDGVYYGVFQELGTSRGVTAKHFMGRAFERNGDAFFKEVKEVLG